MSTVGVRTDLFLRNPATVPITDFFGSVRPVKLLNHVPDIETLKPKGNKSEKKIEKAATKPKKYYYVPPLPTFSSSM